ncbi:MAG: cyclase family protein [Candidatus Micrarchaeaceae archaeon]
MKTLVDLSRPYCSKMPEADGHKSFEVERYRNPKSNAHLSYIKFTSHTGTHIDAPSHFIDGGKTIDQFDLEEFTGIGFVLDISKGKNEAITLPEIEEYEGSLPGVKFLFIRTGWEDLYNQPEYVHDHPYLEPDAAKYLVEKVKFLGIDTLSPEATFSSGKRMGSPVHEILLSGGILVIENVCNLSKVKGRKFKVYAFPLNLKETDGAPARIVAEIDEE